MNDSRSIFCENPRTDFIRSRKLDFQNTIKILFCMENGSLRDELFKSFDNALDTPTASAFVQARNKIKVDAIKHIFNKFNDRTHEDILYKGYRSMTHWNRHNILKELHFHLKDFSADLLRNNRSD